MRGLLIKIYITVFVAVLWILVFFDMGNPRENPVTAM